MKGTSHLIFGTITSIATMATISVIAPSMMAHPAVFVGLSAFGSLLPDIDEPTSLIGRTCLRPISKLINKLFGHRTVTHNVLIMGLIAVLTLRFVSPMFAGLWFGYFGHLFLDGLTAGGLPMFGKKIHLLPYRFKMYSGSTASKVVTWVLSILYAGGCVGLAMIA